VRAYLADVYFVFFANDNSGGSSATFVFGVSWASLSRTNRMFSPLFSTLTVISKVSRSLSFTHKIGCNFQRVKQMRTKTQPRFLLFRMARAIIMLVVYERKKENGVVSFCWVISLLLFCSHPS